MNDYANDQEQWDAIKTWWKANGKLLVAVIVLGLVVSFGWQFWRQHKEQQSEKASALYDQLLVGYNSGNMQLTSDIANELENNFSATPYASIAALFEAKTAAETGNLTLALQKLEWVMDHTHSDALEQIATLRAARVLLAQKNPDKALSLLQKIKAPYLPAANQIKGDIYLAQGNTQAARDAYQTALQSIPQNQPLHADLQQQIEQLPMK